MEGTWAVGGTVVRHDDLQVSLPNLFFIIPVIKLEGPGTVI
jgi:hypothetical protein